MEIEEPRVVTVLEAARLLRITRATVYQRIGDGTLKSIKLCGKRLILRDSIDALFADAA